MAGVRKASGADVKAEPLLVIGAGLGGGEREWMRVYQTDCHGCGGRFEHRGGGGGGGGVRMRCRCGRELCAACLRAKNPKEHKSLVAAASAAAAASPDKRKGSEAWPFSRPVWPPAGCSKSHDRPSPAKKGKGGASGDACWVEAPPDWKCAVCRGQCWCVGGEIRCWRRKNARSRGECTGVRGHVEAFVDAVLKDRQKEEDIDALIAACASGASSMGGGEDKGKLKRTKAPRSREKTCGAKKAKGSHSELSEMVKAAARALEAGDAAAGAVLSDDSDMSDIAIPVLAVASKDKKTKKKQGGEDDEFDRLVREAADLV